MGQAPHITIVDANGNAINQSNPLQTVAPAALGGTNLTSSATGANAAISATLPGVAGSTTYINGFTVTGAGATSATTVTVTITGTISGTLNYVIAVPAGVTSAINPLILDFSRPIPASAANTAIVVNVPAFGIGNTSTAVVAHGYRP